MEGVRQSVTVCLYRLPIHIYQGRPLLRLFGIKFKLSIPGFITCDIRTEKSSYHTSKLNRDDIHLGEHISHLPTTTLRSHPRPNGTSASTTSALSRKSNTCIGLMGRFAIAHARVAVSLKSSHMTCLKSYHWGNLWLVKQNSQSDATPVSGWILTIKIV